MKKVREIPVYRAGSRLLDWARVTPVSTDEKCFYPRSSVANDFLIIGELINYEILTVRSRYIIADFDSFDFARISGKIRSWSHGEVTKPETSITALQA